MKKFGEFLKKHKKLTILVIVIIVILCLVLWVRSGIKKTAAALSQLTAGEVATVEYRSLVDSLSATGKVTSKDSMDILPNVSGVTVKEVLVETGDVVHEGDILMILDSEDLETYLEHAQTNKEVSEAKSGANVAIAKRGLSEAQTAENIQVFRDYEDAQKLYDKYLDAVKEYDDAKAEYDSAVNTYNYRVSEYESYRNEHSDLDEFDFLNKTERGTYYKQNMQTAESEMNSKKSTMESKDKAVDTALDNYASLIRNYEDHERNNDSTVMTKNDSLKSAKLDNKVATLSTDEQILKYEEQVEACTVRAPMDGVVTIINVNEGDKYAGSSAIATVENVESYEIVSEIDEYDISKVKVGQRVVIKTNGTGDTEFEGKVKSIAPRATKAASNSAVSTSVTYKVKIDILDGNDDLKIDMTAKLSIILDEKDNILTVPYDAVQIDDDGRFYVELADEGAEAGDLAPNKEFNTSANEPKRLYVTKGIESDYYIEIIGDGIRDGLKIVVPYVSDGTDFMSLMMEQGAMGGF